MKKILLILTMILSLAGMAYCLDLVEIEKSADVSIIEAGVTYTYSMSVTCTGNCYDVSVWDTIPAGFVAVDGAPTPVITGSVWSWFYLGLTNSTEVITLWGSITNYTPENVTNEANVVGSNVAYDTKRVILEMATPTFTYTATPTFTITPTFTPTVTPTKVVASFFTNKNLINTEIKGTYTSVSVIAYVHNWNTLNYIAIADAIGNSYTIIRKTKEVNDTIFEVLDMNGDTITGDFDYLFKR